ncbi:hypothetical protein [uncultured Bacteroides sp.]|uniref:hypothetical protein n=1 Tax=uncultured Bacteroides sp. TaxID=162156 RepID=UPI002AABD1F0|nr:hypothetical protein [uncultured Bacteroides sp.]
MKEEEKKKEEEAKIQEENLTSEEEQQVEGGVKAIDEQKMNPAEGGLGCDCGC